ncbi:hypothetical protein ACXPWS_11515 [Mycobacterium sp. BMJ-28]
MDSKYDGTTLETVHVVLWISEDLRVEFNIKNPRILAHDDLSIDISILPFGIDDDIDLVGYPYNSIDKIFPANSLEKGFTFNHAIPWAHMVDGEQLWHKLQPGELVVFPGYPVWYDRLETRPIFRSGMLASDPQRSYRKRAGATTNLDGNQQILFDAFSTSGNSGSPVFVAQRGLAPIDLKLMPSAGGPPQQAGTIVTPNFHKSFLVGINAGHFNDTDSDRDNDHAGLSRMHKLSAIMEILRAHTAPSDKVPKGQLRISTELMDAFGGIPGDVRSQAKVSDDSGEAENRSLGE